VPEDHPGLEADTKESPKKAVFCIVDDGAFVLNDVNASANKRQHDSQVQSTT
jgi:hypothetical protein